MTSASIRIRHRKSSFQCGVCQRLESATESKKRKWLRSTKTREPGHLSSHAPQPCPSCSWTPETVHERPRRIALGPLSGAQAPATIWTTLWGAIPHETAADGNEKRRRVSLHIPLPFSHIARDFTAMYLSQDELAQLLVHSSISLGSQY